MQYRHFSSILLTGNSYGFFSSNLNSNNFKLDSVSTFMEEIFELVQFLDSFLADQTIY